MGSKLKCPCCAKSIKIQFFNLYNTLGAVDLTNSNPNINASLGDSKLQKVNTFSLKNILIGIVLAVTVAALYFLSRYNYLLFHGVVEVFTVVIAIVIFTIAWNTRKISDNNYMLFIGMAFVFVAGFDLLHTLAFKGMGVFPDISTNLATQLWIITRYLFAFSILIPILFVNRKIKPTIIIAGYSAVTALLLLSLFYWNNFPQAYIDGAGLTTFKIASEFVISAALLLGIGLLIRSRRQFSNNVFRLLLAAMAVAIATEMSFTLYTDVYGVANMIGHMLDFLSFFLIYRALVNTSLTRPYDMLFRNLKASEERNINRVSELTQVNAELEKEIGERKKAEIKTKESESIACQRAEDLQRLQVKLEEKAAEVEEYATNMENLAQERLRQLQNSERLAAIGATAAMVGHDLRNPLQAISGDLYFAKKDIAKLPDSQQKKNMSEYIETIQSSVDYINKIVQDLQDYARPIKLNLHATNLDALLSELLTKLEAPPEISVTYSVAENTKIIMTDSLVLKRILTNLASNAVQAMPNGGKLTFTTISDDGTIVITVEDTGIGISEEVKDKLFTPMFTTKAKGQGFGLVVVKRMTEALGGKITFESEVGKGTKFVVSIPASIQ